MNEIKISEIVAELCKSLKARDYEKFVSFFAEEAIFEIPFTVNGGTVIKGLLKIKEHFRNIRQNPLANLIQIESVSAKTYPSTIYGTVTVEYFTKGTSLNTGEKFEIQSSIALIQFNESGIIYYKDYPNTIGIAKKAGALSQLAAMLTK